jgi:hypothetical protein
VVFIKEIVPRRAVTFVARRVYNENYVTCPMRTRLVLPDGDNGCGEVEYAWRGPSQWNRMSAKFGGTQLLPKPGSEEEFITEHYYGYTRQRDGGTIEYQVAHPRWRIWPAYNVEFAWAAAEFYGPEYAETLSGKPSSAFVVDGSAIEVYRGICAA